MASKAGKAGRKPGKRKKASAAGERLTRVEQMVDLLLQASLRGRLLPSERRGIKSYLEGRKKLEVPKPQKKGPRCPVCRSPLADPGVRRCPWCSVLLPASGRKRRSRKEAKKK